MRLGVCWYPEQHPPERWSTDVAMMRDAGLELVRLGEFAWGRLEPRPGTRDLDWMERAIDVAADAGLHVVVGTPAAAPPRWLFRAQPGIRLVGDDGIARSAGSRRATCPTAPALRSAVASIVDALVDRFGRHEAIVAWQIDNEPGNHDSARCWCPACADAFRAWVHGRYGTLDRLNEAWGTAFWSGQYGEWAEVDLPRRSSTAQSPSLLLAHRRFASDQVLDGLRDQRARIAGGSPGRDVLVNLYWDDTFVNARRAHALGGVAAIDAYPHGVEGPEAYSFLLDLAHGAAGTGRAWVMEQQPGPINWTQLNPPVPPDLVRLWGWQAALHGIEAALFFSWRPTRSGQEQYHAGLLRHDGSPDRGYAEAGRLAAELRATMADEPVVLQRPPSPVALLHDYEDAWAIEIDPHQAGLTHRALVQPVHAALRRLGVEVDVRGSLDDLDGYRMIIAPALHLTTDARLGRLRAALERGTFVVLGPRSLVKDDDDCWLETALPGGLAGSLGARVVEGLSQTLPVSVQPGDAPAGPWTDVLEPTTSGVAIEATYGGSTYLAGRPAVVRNGNLAYVGCSSVEAWRDILARWLPMLGIATGAVPDGRERFVRGSRTIELDHARPGIDGLPSSAGRDGKR